MKCTLKYLFDGLKPVGRIFILLMVLFIIVSSLFMPSIIIFALISALFAAFAAFIIINAMDSKKYLAEPEMTKEVINSIKHFKYIYLMGHKRADFDSFGACAGIHAICRALGKESHIIMGTDIFAVKDIYDKFAVNKEYDGVFVTAAQAEKKIDSQCLVILCDTHVTRLVESYKVIEKAGKTIVLDHHKESEQPVDGAEKIFIKTYFSSCCELTATILSSCLINPSALEAEALLAGMMVDTRNFGINSGEHVFSTAAYLCRCGADSVAARMLFKSTMALERIKANAVESSKMYKKGIIFSVCESNHKNVYLACARAADELLDIKGVEASIVMCRYSGTVYVSGRSNGRIDVESILKKVGGGGHITMAGAQFENHDIQTADKLLKKAVDEYLTEVN